MKTLLKIKLQQSLAETYRSSKFYILDRSNGKDPNDTLGYTYKTDFHDPYTGIIRGVLASQSSTELISTGTQMLADPIKLSEYINIDREHILFTLWALDFKKTEKTIEKIRNFIKLFKN